MFRNPTVVLSLIAFVTGTAHAQSNVIATQQNPVQATPAYNTAAPHYAVGTPQFPVTGSQYPGGLSGELGEQLYPFDQQDPWLHGFIQEMPAYGGFTSFRPYNYKHALSQIRVAVAAGWGMPPTLPYSQQFWHRYQNVIRENGRSGTSATAPNVSAAGDVSSQLARPNTAAPFQPAPGYAQSRIAIPNQTTVPNQFVNPGQFAAPSRPTFSRAALSVPAPGFGPTSRLQQQQPVVAPPLGGFNRLNAR